MNVLVTGGTGFIGSHVAERLVRMGHDVAILHRTRSSSRLPAYGGRFVAGDLTDPASLRAACARKDAVVHAAGLVGTGAGWPMHRSVNVLGTRNVVRAAIAAGVPRLVHLSSLVVHAAPARGAPIRETTPLRRRIPAWDHYTLGKLLAETIVRSAREMGRIAAIVIRPGLVLGPRDRWTTPWILRALERPAVMRVGSGDNLIPCVVVDELAEAIARAATWPALESDTFDLAGDAPVTQRGLVEWHARAAGRTVPSFAVQPRAARAAAWMLDLIRPLLAARHSPPLRMAVLIASADARVDCARAAAELGWRGSASCEDAVRRATEWEQRERGSARRAPSSGRPERGAMTSVAAP